MPDIVPNGVRIHYELAGSGEPLVLIHGYSASGRTNWEMPGWFETLAPAYRLIVPDVRGHGHSAKPHATEAYSLDLMARDVLACMDAEGVKTARVMGYSMGGMITLELLLNHPDRVSAAVIGGMGSRFPERGTRLRPGRGDEPGAEPPPPRKRRGPKFFAAFVRRYDPFAMRAVFQGVFRARPPVDASRLGEIHQPVLLVCGMRDALYPGVKEMAAEIPGAKLVALSGVGHLAAISDPRYKAAVADFFGSR